jgi:hypothetical protein
MNNEINNMPYNNYNEINDNSNQRAINQIKNQIIQDKNNINAHKNLLLKKVNNSNNESENRSNKYFFI